MRRLVGVLLITVLVGSAWPGAQALAAPSALGDFNADGIADLAIGVPGEDLGPSGSITDAGAVNVLYGASGISTTPSQLWHQDSSRRLDPAEPGDHFGAALAAGDFNADGTADLAVGAPDETVGTIDGAGAVNVLYGSASGLRAPGSQFFNQNSSGIAEAAEAGDGFGWSLAAGDFGTGPGDDLAVGVLRESVGTVSEAGAVQVLFGAPPSGLSATGSQFWHQNSPGVLDSAEPGDLFGASLAPGDFNGDGRPDLAVGAMFEDVGTVGDAGAVNVLYGGTSTLVAGGNQFWHQNSPGILDTAEPEEDFGQSLAAGDFNGNGRTDLAVGVDGEVVGTLQAAGAVNVLYGTPSALSATGNQLWHQDSAGVLDIAEAGDAFGRAVTTGDFNGDARADLAVGAAFESVGTVADAGAVNVLYGATSALSAAGNQLWNQNSAGVLDLVETGDRFGESLVSGDFNGNGRADLAVGVFFEDVGTIADAGAVNALYGAGAALSARGNQFWHQNSAGVPDVAEAGDLFGESLEATGGSQAGE